ncbi:MAG: prepilin-type N-terminal cleavage/methylation domain-containing protein [Burkholderiaceae bacterium]
MGPLKQRGFTLLELLIVLVVIGIGTAMVAVKAFPSDQQLLRREAERLAQLLSIAQEQAALRSQTLAWQPNTRGFAFFEVRDERLLPAEAEPNLRPRAWEVPELRYSLRVDGQLSSRLDIEPEPQLRPIAIVLAKNRAAVRLERQLGGRFVIHGLPESAAP